MKVGRFSLMIGLWWHPSICLCVSSKEAKESKAIPHPFRDAYDVCLRALKFPRKRSRFLRPSRHVSRSSSEGMAVWFNRKKKEGRYSLPTDHGPMPEPDILDAMFEETLVSRCVNVSHDRDHCFRECGIDGMMMR